MQDTVLSAPDLALVQACEERIVNCWPAVETLVVGDFVVRFAHGYSGRANSASPIRANAELCDADIDHIEQLYRKAGLVPCFRATPLITPAMRSRLDARGYRLRDASFGMILPLADRDFAIAPQADIAFAPPRDWLEGISRAQSPEKRNPTHLEAIVGRIRVPVSFVSLRIDGIARAYGMAATDRDMAELGSIMLDPEIRGRGLGRALTMTLLAVAIKEV